jgi:hypothetical protein
MEVGSAIFKKREIAIEKPKGQTISGLPLEVSS